MTDDLYLSISQESLRKEILDIFKDVILNDGAMNKYRADHEMQQYRAVHALAVAFAEVTAKQNGVINQLTRRLKDAERDLAKIRVQSGQKP